MGFWNNSSRNVKKIISFRDFAVALCALKVEYVLERQIIKIQEMCQYDTDAPAQGHPHPHAGILQKMKLKKAPLLS